MMYYTKQDAMKIARAYCTERGCTLKKTDRGFAVFNKKTKERVSGYLTAQTIQDFACNNQLYYLIQA